MSLGTRRPAVRRLWKGDQDRGRGMTGRKKKPSTSSNGRHGRSQADEADDRLAAAAGAEPHRVGYAVPVGVPEDGADLSKQWWLQRRAELRLQLPRVGE